MAKKKAVKRSSTRSSKPTSQQLHHKHPNLIWLLPLFLVVFIGYMLIMNNVNNSSDQAAPASSLQNVQNVKITPEPTASNAY